MKYKVTRDLTRDELFGADAIKKGDIIFSFGGCTYGCIGEGIACSREAGLNPFFEMPIDAIEAIG